MEDESLDQRLSYLVNRSTERQPVDVIKSPSDPAS